MTVHFTITISALSNSTAAAVHARALGVDLTHPPAGANDISVTQQAIRSIPVLAVELTDDARVIQAALEAARVPFLMRTSRKLSASAQGRNAIVRCDIDGEPVAGIVLCDGRPMANIDDVMALARYTELAEAVLKKVS